MNVLIIDDSVAQVQHLSRILSDLGHQVIGHGRTGADGIKLYSEKRPDVVFLDVVMPEMDGLTALRTIRSMDPTARVIMLTAVAGVGGKVEEAIHLGATDVLSKPYTDTDIRRAVSKIEKAASKS